jgi:FTR1 family protein
MFESFIIMVRESIEAALVIGVLLAVLRQSGRRHLEKPVYIGLTLAILASIGAAIAMHFIEVSDELYAGSLYLVSAAFVITMMVWMHRNARTLRSRIEQRVQHAAAAAPERSGKEAWALGAFAFLMVFREGAEAVMFLSAVGLTTDALLGFIGSLLGLIVAIVFAVVFVQGSLRVNLRRFFAVTEWVLAIFVAQLLLNGYHEFSEAGIFPATQRSMALVGPIVRNNSLFILAIVGIPLFIWFSRGARRPAPVADALPAAERRLALAAARREKFYGYGAIVTTLLVLSAIGVLYAREVVPKKLPAPELIAAENELVTVPFSKIEDGHLHRFGFVTGGRTVRFLVLKGADGKIRTGMDACAICGSFGYVEEEKNLICLNCSAEINPLTLGSRGGCNPIPLEAELTAAAVRIRVAALEKEAHAFAAAGEVAQTEIDPICGMRVKITEAAAFATVNGKTWYFCSEKCRAQFTQGR